jgi:hypothetical protein
LSLTSGFEAALDVLLGVLVDVPTSATMNCLVVCRAHLDSQQVADERRLELLASPLLRAVLFVPSLSFHSNQICQSAGLDSAALSVPLQMIFA